MCTYERSKKGMNFIMKLEVYIKNVGIFLMCFIIIFYLLPATILAFGPANSTIYNGIDVSGYQGNINFEQVKDAGIKIIYIKSSEGFNYIDSKFERNYEEAKKAGLKIGFYHYVTARTEEQAISQAKFFASVIAGKVPEAKLAMDFEYFGNLTKKQINQIGLTFLKEVEKITKKQVVIYSNTSTAKNIWQGEITNYPLWIAQYEVEEPQENGNWKNWVGWQYTDMGEVKGISTYVDRNQFTKDILLSEPTEIPKPEEPGEPETPEKPINHSKTITITIKKGDTLSGLALQYNTTVSELVKLNSIANPNLIYAGAKLTVPNNQNYTTEIYTVQKGNTLSGIAQKFNTTVAELVTLNNIANPNLIYTGQKLIVPTQIEHDCGHMLYTIKPGDTLWSLAKRYNTTIANIVKLNRIQNANKIYPGQMFRIR